MVNKLYENSLEERKFEINLNHFYTVKDENQPKSDMVKFTDDMLQITKLFKTVSGQNQSFILILLVISFTEWAYLSDFDFHFQSYRNF